jgi:hypothetical protein
VTHILAAPINAQGSQMLTVETARWKVEKWLFNVGEWEMVHQFTMFYLIKRFLAWL